MTNVHNKLNQPFIFINYALFFLLARLKLFINVSSHWFMIGILLNGLL